MYLISGFCQKGLPLKGARAPFNTTPFSKLVTFSPNHPDADRIGIVGIQVVFGEGDKGDEVKQIKANRTLRGALAYKFIIPDEVSC
jgi:hypothetical protein